MKKIIPFCLAFLTPALAVGQWQPEEFRQPSLCRAAQNQSSYDSSDLKAMRRLVDGTDRWLFRSNLDLKDDFSLSSDMLAELARLSRAYQYNGIRLAMIRIPTRGLVYNKKLTPFSYQLTGFQYNKAVASFQNSNQAIRQTGIMVPDLSELFSWSDDSLRLFFKRDNHWTPEGARVVSSMVAEQLEGVNLTDNPKNYVTRYSGLLKKRRTPFEKAAYKLCGLSYPGEYAKALTTSAEVSASEDSLFGDDETPPAFLLGTSFSKGTDDYNFVGSLKEHMRSDILNLSVTGGNLDAAMDQYLHGLYQENIKPKMLFWEVPGYLSFSDPVFFRRMIPALYQSCHRSSVKLSQEISLQPGANHVLLNKDPNSQYLTSHQHVLAFKFSNSAIRDFQVKIWYASGNSEKVRVQRSKRIENTGSYYLELSAEQHFKNQNFIAAELILDSDIEPGSVEARLCQRRDTNQSSLKVAGR